jgi:hypothetical protein
VVAAVRDNLAEPNDFNVTTCNGNRCSRIVRPLQRKDDMGNCCQLAAGTSRQAFRLASQAPIRRAVQSESFAFPDVMEAIQQGRHQLPIVLVDGEIVLSGGKLNEGLITRHVRERLQKTC